MGFFANPIIFEKQMNAINLIRAENETRTRDPNLGKVVLYQLSYFRKQLSEEEETRTPTPRGTATSKQRVYHSATSPYSIAKYSAQDRSRTCTPLDTRT